MIQALYQRLMEFTGDGVYRYTFGDGKILLANQGLVKTLDLDCTPEELAGKYLKDVLIYTDKEGSVRQALEEKGEIRGFEYHFKTLKGDDRWVIHDSILVTDPITHERAVDAIVKDITERKKAERQLAAEEARLRVTLRSIGDGVIATDTAGKIVLMNAVAEQLTGWQQEAALGRPLNEIFRIINEKTRQPCINPVEKVFRFGTVVELANHTALIARDGTERSIADSGAPIRDPGGNIIGVVLVFRDITDSKEAEEELRLYRLHLEEVVAQRTIELQRTNKQLAREVEDRKQAEKTVLESKRLMQDVLDNSSSLVYIIDTDSRFLLANRRLEALLGVAGGRLVGQTREIFLPKDIADHHRQNDLQVMSEKKPVVFEEENIETDGRHIYSTVKFPLINAQGQIYAVGGLSTDITERKLAAEKLEAAIADLERSNKELEQFAYVASHDLQEPLRKVASFTQLLAERYSDRLDADAKEFIAYAVDGAHRMQGLITDLLAYSRVGTRTKPFAPADCESILQHAMANLEIAINESGAIVTHDRLPTVTGDDLQLVQLFQNLIGNAIKFRGESPPRVHVSAVKKEKEWIFRVRDNGIGIDPQYFERLFIIFQRLHSKTEYPGSGIGLAISKKVVERHGGHIWVESEPGKGSTFYFTIPEQ